MEGEFNNLVYNNTATSFSSSTNNTATSDELLTNSSFQTTYSKSKKKKGKIVGISIALTTTAIMSGGVLINTFIKNPPKVVNPSYSLVNSVFSFSFDISNPKNYKIIYVLKVNEVEVINEEASKETHYEGSYSKLKKLDQGEFIVSFSNRLDYIKNISTYRFVVGG